MNEYQYYEFQALDRPLTGREMQELRACSTRATITPTRFVNFYDWGSLKADLSVWMERYFDAFLHVANWGTHELMLRLPGDISDLRVIKTFCCGERATATAKGDFLILDFFSDDEPGAEDGWDDGSGWLASLVPLRADILGGDHRALYFAWLLCVQHGELEADAIEPPVPPGLGQLTAPLQAFVDFLRIDGDLLAVAAERSPEVGEATFRDDLARWIANVPEDDKNQYLVRLAAGDAPRARAELLRRFRGEGRGGGAKETTGPRAVAELMVAAERRAAERRHREAERAARERARREREAAERRERHLDALAEREAETWRVVEAHVATKRPKDYDEAARLLGDLRDLAVRDGRAAEAEDRIRALRKRHARKPSFIARLEKAGLVRAGS